MGDKYDTFTLTHTHPSPSPTPSPSHPGGNFVMKFDEIRIP